MQDSAMHQDIQGCHTNKQLYTLTQNHEKSLREFTKMLPCYYCPDTCSNRPFQFKSELIQHQEKHISQRSFVCKKDCNHIFNYTSSLPEHLHVQYSGVQPYKYTEVVLTQKPNQSYWKNALTTFRVTTVQNATSYLNCGAHRRQGHAEDKLNRTHQADGCLTNESTLQEVRSTEIVVKVEEPDEDEISLEMLIKSSELLNNLNEEVTRDNE
ncbi:hypothetical protein ACROYT_G004691 [Oculina patagonica]